MLFRHSKLTQNLFVTSLLVIGLATATVGCKGKMGQKPEKSEAVAQKLEQPTAQKGPAQGETDSDVIPIGTSYVKGNPKAPVTVVEFSDFQCPYCSRGHETINQLLEKYPDKVRVVFKNFPLPFHKQAAAAAAAALAAGEQGKFWEMHDKLFDNQRSFSAHADDMKGYTSDLAKDLGLDVAKFQADFDKFSKANPAADDQKLGEKLGVNGTPAFFINGKLISGAQPLENFSSIVDAELADVAKANLKPEELYAARVKANYKKPTPPAAPKPVVAMVPVDKNDFIKGNNKDPLVTIVEFSDFQCPYCSRVNPTIDQVEKNFGKDIRLVYKQNPLPFHQYAKDAAKASIAAGKQGKFWEMHDKLFQNQSSLGQPDIFEKFAKDLGLNMGKFKKDFASPETDAQVAADLALGQKVGARGTPNFFINGVQLVGAQPYPAFEDAIKKQLDIAKKIADDKKLSGDALYEEVVKFNQANAAADAPPSGDAPTPAAPAPTVVDAAKLAQGNAYAKGPKDAKITITEFSDFQCPFCSRGTQNLEQVLQKFNKQVRVVFKNFPLPFHQYAEPAARAALAAGKQGKFWEMHDKLFGNQATLGQPGIFEKFAKELGLNMAKFQKDFNSDELKKQVQDDIAQGSAVGVHGTPAFFINGQLLSGAQPPEKFTEIIEEQLKK